MSSFEMSLRNNKETTIKHREMVSTKTLNTLRRNPKLSKLVRTLQIANEDKSLDMSKVILDLKLPLNYHLYVTGNFSELMEVKFR